MAGPRRAYSTLLSVDRIPSPLRCSSEDESCRGESRSSTCELCSLRGRSRRRRPLPRSFGTSPSSSRRGVRDAIASGAVGTGVPENRRAPKGSPKAEAWRFVWKPGSGVFPEACRRTGTLERTRDNQWRSPSGCCYAPEGGPTPFEKGAAAEQLSCSRPHRHCEPPDRAATRAREGRPSTNRRSSFARLSPGGEVGTRLSALRRFAIQAWT
jgi:hypothetical protein